MTDLLTETRRTALEATAYAARAAHFHRMAEGLRSPLDGSERVSKGGQRTAMEDCAIAAAEAQQRAEMAAKRHTELVAQADRAIASVEPAELREVLHMRYIACLRIEEIADELHISKRTCYRRHTDALALLEAQKNGG